MHASALGATGSGGKLMRFDMMIPVTAFLVAVVACAFDLRTRRIPNALTFGAALAGLLFHRLTAGPRARWSRPEDGSSASVCSCRSLRCAAWAAAT